MCKPQSCKVRDTENQGNITHQKILHLCSYNECKWDEIPDRELKRIILRMFKEVSQGVQICMQHSSVTSASFVCSGHCLACLRDGLWSVSVRQTNPVCTKEKTNIQNHQRREVHQEIQTTEWNKEAVQDVKEEFNKWWKY